VNREVPEEVTTAPSEAEDSEPQVPSVNLAEVLARVEGYLEHCWDVPLTDWAALDRRIWRRV